MKFNLHRIPFLVALGAFLIYLLTLSRGITASNLELASKVAGWDWQPIVGSPLVWLCSLPLRILPAAWVPIATNVFAAACGAIILGLVARTVELLPPLRPLQAMGDWKSRLPALLAAVVCGMEINFWQSATGGMIEIVQLLPLVIAVWCLLEFRTNNQVRWLYAAVFVWGLGMAENWMMIPTLPLFVAGLVWVRPRNFLEYKFVLRLAGWGLAGFSIYALLPMVNGLSPNSPWDFGSAWLYSLKATKHLVLGVYLQFWRAHRLMAMAVIIFYFGPVLFCLMQLRAEQAPDEYKPWLERAQIWFFRGITAALLLVCLWQAFDPVIGPRGILKQQLGMALPLLSFSYLNALVVGFLTGRLLMMKHEEPSSLRIRRSDSKLPKTLAVAVPRALAVLLFVMAVTLAARNLGAVMLVNSHPLTEFGEMAARSLPSGGGIVMSDFPDKLVAFQAAETRHRNAGNWLAVDMHSLPAPAYRERLQKQHPGFWLLSTNRQQLTPVEIPALVQGLARTNRLFYLHPTFGDLAELFNFEPVGQIFELKPFPTNSISPPPVPASVIAQNESAWNALTPEIELLQHAGQHKEPVAVKWIEAKLHLNSDEPEEIILLKNWYSTGLNAWGVDLQRAGQLPAAQHRFTQALELTTNNWIARANLFSNTNLQSGTRMNITDVGDLAGLLGTMQKFSLSLEQFGPVDEPALCYILGNAYAQAALPRLALQNLERATELAPGVVAPRLALASLYTHYGMVDLASNSINQLHNQIKTLPAASDIETSLRFLEANNFLTQSNLAGVRQIFESMLQQHPADTTLERGIFQAYVSMGDYTNAERIVSRWLERQPDDISAQIARSGILLQTGRAGDAIPLLNRILAVTNSIPARLNRAIAYMKTTNYAAAEADYLELQSLAPDSFFVNLGLGDIALHKNNTNLAVQYFTQCLSNTSPASAGWNLARARLDAITSRHIP
jgi:tetratricopeptide (TPR) repeat protein